ncbi:REP-associated tyrosine transposase [Jannaschia sp. KMU-145]|uniref:REP-associated tyrosine transposase n=1 Tax=Jannaschia halovivens TaxID=3388667 RepID=UPI00396B4464
MSRYIRPAIPGATIFFTVALAERGSRLLVDEIDLLRRAYGATLRDRPLRTDAIVVLPDHLHCVWTLPEGDADYATRWRLIKARVSRALPMPPRRASQSARRERGLWQRRYLEDHIRDEAALHTAIARCHRDPVKHGLTDDPFGWPHSSIHRDMAAALRHGAAIRAREPWQPPAHAPVTLPTAAPLG